MSIYLGNMTVDEIEKRAGVEFPEELREYMKPRHQSAADNIQPGKWHCFDIPFNLLCGDRATATEIHRHLAPLSKDFKQSLQISLKE